MIPPHQTKILFDIHRKAMAEAIHKAMPRIIAAIDQSTTSTRCMLFDRAGTAVAFGQLEHRQIYPRPGWVEHDPVEIWQNTYSKFSARAGLPVATYFSGPKLQWLLDHVAGFPRAQAWPSVFCPISATTGDPTSWRNRSTPIRPGRHRIFRHRPERPHVGASPPRRRPLGRRRRAARDGRPGLGFP